MTGVQEYKEAVVGTPQKPEGPGRSKTLRVLAIMIAALAAIGLAWLAFRDSGDAPIEDSVVSATIDSTDEALVGTNVGFPLGTFENRDSGLRILRLNEDGIYTFSTPQGFRIRGTFEVDGDLFTFLTVDIDPQADPGTYNWTYEDGTLEFSVIADADRNRYAFITYPFVLTE